MLQVVTLWYRAPEILMGARQYACPVDVWSIATIFVEMITKYVFSSMVKWKLVHFLLICRGDELLGTIHPHYLTSYICLNRRPLFAGDSEIDELYQIFRVLSTPTEDSWPGVSSLPDYSVRSDCLQLLFIMLRLTR